MSHLGSDVIIPRLLFAMSLFVQSVVGSTIFSGAVKLQKEKEKAKKERKKEKKEKKEKSRADSGKKEEKQHDGKKRKYEEFSRSDNKLGGYLKTREDESAQLERSSLTEEQGPENICDSSDSTQNSSRRKKLEPAEISHNAHGVGLRIRLPLLRHKDVEPPPRSIEQPCSSGRRETVPAQRETRDAGHPQLPSSSEQPCFSGRIVAAPANALAKVTRGKHASAEAGRIRSCGCSCDSLVRRQYKKLMRDWNPPPLRVEDPDFDDLDWLFGKPAAARRQHQGQGGAGGQVAGKDLDRGDALSSWPPRACYLPEVGVYALPYVVPF